MPACCMMVMILCAMSGAFLFFNMYIDGSAGLC